ncbi:MAG: beta-galactosidase trimerization domain-containing protein [Kiritimatiellaeota bacterium]|nr:beta-galactosidase trimerization domain-containing protein [Kiritimatiellota bacterium]
MKHTMQMTIPWYKTALRRCVVDMHIPDWDEKFLSEFDPAEYVRMLKQAKAQSAVVYAHSHTGLFNYPTRIGKQHANLKGRDIFGEMADGCHENGIAVVCYVSLIFDRWAADTHPDWRIISFDGKPWAGVERKGNSRHGTCCPNTPYRDYVLAWTREAVTATVRKRKPGASVEHQASTLVADWTIGISDALAAQNDFLQGDFYGDNYQGSFVRKLLDHLSPNRPIGFETSSAMSLVYHTTMKPEALLEAKAATAIADGCAFIFIDAINPVGTLNAEVYARMGKVFGKLMPYYAHMGGARVEDVAIYFSTQSKCDFARNGKDIALPAVERDPHLNAAMNACRSLFGAHIPLGVITRKDLKDLGKYRVLVLPNVLMMDEDECAAIRQWVRKGGCLYAGGYTSLVDTAGNKRNDFMLGDVLGIKRLDDLPEGNFYIAPAPGNEKLFDDYSVKYPVMLKCPRLKIEARPGATVLGNIVAIWPAPDPTKFASIHSNPPWQPTDQPAIVMNRFGKGRAIYAVGELENADFARGIFVNLIKSLNAKFSFEADVSAVVEVTMFDQPDRKRWIVSLVNFQKDLPNIPINGIKVRVRPGRRKFKRAVLLPNGSPLKSMKKNDMIEIAVPRLNTLQMIAVEYR